MILDVYIIENKLVRRIDYLNISLLFTQVVCYRSDLESGPLESDRYGYDSYLGLLPIWSI